MNENLSPSPQPRETSLDQNLSHRLASRLKDLYPGSSHVRDLGLQKADDDIVWEYALQQGYILVSKDSDFHQRSFLAGPPPKVIWIRQGNCSTSEIESILRKRHPDILQFIQDSAGSFLSIA